MRILTPEFKTEVERITELSKIANKDNPKKILEMMKAHVDEIDELFQEKNKHYQIETADLIVLSLELLLSEGDHLEPIFNKCLPRFFKKLNEKIGKL